MLHLTIAGTLGRDAEIRNAGGTNLCSFSVACDTGFGDKKQTTWVNCTLWGKRGESLNQYLTKGTKIVGVGELSLRTYEKDGQTRTAVEMRVSDVKIMGGGQDRQQGDLRTSGPETGSHGPSGGGVDTGPGDLDDEIPF